MRRLVDLALPIIGINLLNVTVLAVDTAMCGRLPDAEGALTALGFATQIVFLLMVLMIGLTVGTVALVARSVGAGDWERANHVMIQSTLVTLGLAVFVAVAANVGAPWLLALMGASPDTVDLGLAYLRPLLSLAAFNYLNILYGAVFRAIGDTRTPFRVSLLANGVNLVLDYGLILGNLGMPALGLAGAAYGTVAAQMVAVSVMVFLLRGRVEPRLFLPLRPRPVDRRLVRDLVRIGLPAAGDMLLINVGFLSILGMLGRLDEIAVAAHGMGLRIQAIAFVPGMGVAQATGVLVGQALGAGDRDAAWGVLRSSMILCVGIMSTLAVVITLGAGSLVGLFGVPPGTALEAYSIQWIRVLGLCMPLAAVHLAFVGMLQGAGATRISLQVNFVGTLLFQVPGSYLLGFPLAYGVIGVWASFPLSFVVKAAMAGAAVRRGDWAQVGARV